MDYRQQILNILHSENESRAEMTRRLGVTKAYITKLTARLLEEGLIEERDVKDTSFGRPQQCLAVKEGCAWSINIMLRRGSFQATLNDYRTLNAPLASEQFSLPDIMTPDELTQFIAKGVQALCLQASLAVEHINVVSIALQGGIEHTTGVVRYCPLFPDENITLMAHIEQRLGLPTRIYNIAHCTTYLLAKRWPGRSWIAFMPGFGSLGFGYCTHGIPGLGENGFYPEIVHLPYEGGLEQAFNVNQANKAAGIQQTANALYFAICCTAPIHNIRLVIATGELFEDYGDEILPLTQQMLAASPNRHVREITLHHDKTGHNYGWQGLVQLSSDAITAQLA
ncbi:ROK family protein [Klebsiella quasivariicola]|uniref:ROK family transcriptional regulator n=1 Tax=Klebsiella quasivariicola TaxID=2026240 RepID=UPI001183C4E2|nr:ROK family transcriptional regulator [Klebsiella quasivariicola]TTM52861.1 ROK family protein [Klebsiella quasivariicola]